MNYEDDRQDTLYQNIITNHGNIITTFAATQQLKVMLGEISVGLAKDDEEERRRLSNCKDTLKGWEHPCTEVSCQNPARFCDGSHNYPYVAYLRGGEKFPHYQSSSLIIVDA